MRILYARSCQHACRRQSCVSVRLTNTKDVDESDCSPGRWHGTFVNVASSSSSNDGQTEHHTTGAHQEHLSPPESVVHASTSCCRDPSGDGVDSVQQKLSVGIGNAHLVDEERKVVAARSLAGSTMVSRNLVLMPDNVVAGELSEPREREVDHGAVTLRSGLDEIADVKEVLVGK